MKLSELFSAFAGVGLALVVAAPQGTTSSVSSVATTTSLVPSSSLSAAFRTGMAIHACTASGTGTRGGTSPCAATDAPYYVNSNGAFINATNPLQGIHAAPTSTFATSVSSNTTSSSTPMPTGPWSDGEGTLNADQFSVIILSGSKSIQVQTASKNGNTVPYYHLDCPNDGDDFETITGYVQPLLPWYLLIHGGNVCSGSLKLGAGFDNTWIRYSNLEQINVPTSDLCNTIGESMRCVLPLNPTKAS